MQINSNTPAFTGIVVPVENKSQEETIARDIITPAIKEFRASPAKKEEYVTTIPSSFKDPTLEKQGLQKKPGLLGILTSTNFLQNRIYNKLKEADFDAQVVPDKKLERSLYTEA